MTGFVRFTQFWVVDTHLYPKYGTHTHAQVCAQACVLHKVHQGQFKLLRVFFLFRYN